MRRWKFGNIYLYQGDWRKIPVSLPQVIVISDPPYGINHKKGRSGKELTDSKSISSTKKRWCQSIVGDSGEFNASEFKSAAGIGFTGASHFYHTLPVGGSLHCWDKRGNYKPLDQADADMVWISNKRQSRVFHLVWRGICRHAENRDPIVHPTQKPVALMEWIIDLLGVTPADVVFDPYCGSGTTGVACKKRGIPFIGCEIVPEFYETAKERIRHA